MNPTPPNRSIKVFALFIFLIFTSFNIFSQTIIDIPIAISDADDAEERISDGVMDLASSDLEFCADDDGDQLVGIRFQNVTVPQGATITDAYIQFQVDENINPGAITIDIEGIDIDNASAFTGTNFNISQRVDGTISSGTTATSSWSPGEWATVGANEQTSSISTIVKEVIDRVGWSTGNDMAFVFSPNSGSPARRYAEDSDTFGQGAVLHIEYTIPAGSEINIVGNSTNILDGTTAISTIDDTDFGSVNEPSGSVAHTFTIQNFGASSLTLSNPVLTGDTADFTVTTNPTSPVSGGANTTFTITFDPTTTGTRSATVSITNGDSDENPYTFNIEGIGVLPTPEINVVGNSTNIPDGNTAISITDDTDFGAVNTASGSNVNTFTIENLGTVDLTLDSPSPYIVITGDASDFTLTANPSSPIIASGNTTFSITFDPTVSGVRTATISIANNDSDEDPYTFDVEGIGMSITPNGNWTYLDDGSDQGTGWYNTTFASSGNAILGYGTIDGGTVATTVSYGPSSSDKYRTTYFTKTITVTAGEAANTTLVMNAVRDDGMVVYVNGTEVWRDNITGVVSYTTLADGAIGGTDESAWITTSVSNILTTGSNVIAVEIHQATAGSTDLAFDFSLYTDNSVTFVPEINLTGNGVDIASGDNSPSSVDDTDFGGVDVTAGTVAHTFTIENTGGLDLTLDSASPYVVITGDTSDFTLTANPTTPISGNGSTTFTITFDPTTQGERNATISILNNDTDETTYTFDIKGSGAIFGTGASWSYLDDGTNQGTAWYGVAFDYSSWATGNSMLGYGVITGGAITTTTGYIYTDAPTNSLKNITTYFRKSFTVTAADVANNTLVMNAVRDDGMVVYIDGNQVWSDNMPGTFDYTTNSSTIVSGADESAWNIKKINNPFLTPGTYEIGVEIHQRDGSSTDLSFDFEMYTSDELLIEDGSWSYYDQGAEPIDVGGFNWKELSYVESWSTGDAELGYGDGDETTTVSYGGNASDKYITTYFRKTFTASGTDVSNSTLQISAVRDDGIVIYINGVEVLRNNMPTGTIVYSTTAFGDVNNDYENFEPFWNVYEVPNTLVSGSNQIAVEIHQYSNTSDDISFNLALETNNDVVIVPTVKPDRDTDGVEDYLDADDDNDGIPDVVEGCFTSLPETLETEGDGETSILSSLPITTALNDGNSITYSVNNTANFGDLLAYDAGEHGYGLRVRGDATDAQLTLDFTTPVSNLFFKLIDFDEGEMFKIDVYDEFGVIVDLSTEEGIYHLGSYVEYIGSNTIDERYDSAAPNNNHPESRADDIYGAAYFYFPNINVSKVVYTVNYTGGGTIRIVGVQYCSRDTDGDGIDDFYDADSDNDGIPDIVEAGGVDVDGNGIVDSFIDIDGDGVSSLYDSDDTTYYIEESGTLTNFDFDYDGINNEIDLDSDNDGILDIIEINLPDINFDGQIDGFVDANSNGFHDSFDGGASPLATGADISTNGLPDSYPIANIDSSGKPNYLDIDSDDDGIPDHTEAQATTATFIDYTAGDSDGDGIIDVFDFIVGFGAKGLIPVDSELIPDGIPDYLDLDSDNDGELDLIEGHDANGDDVVDASDLGSCLSSVTAFTGKKTGFDIDGDGLDDGFDNNIGASALNYNPTNDGISPMALPNVDDIATVERDFREPLQIYNLIDFDGVNDYIDFADKHNFTSSFTLQAWVKEDATFTGDGMIVSKRDCNKGTNLGYSLGLENHYPNITWYDDLGVEVLNLTSDYPIDSDRWYHISVTYDEASTTARIYIDGIEVAEDTGVSEPPSATSESFLIGAKFDDTDLTYKLSNEYKGWMDEVRIWDIALTEAQLRSTIYQEIEISGSGIKGKKAPLDIAGLDWNNDLLGYYTFNNVVSGDLIDDSSKGKNGRIRNITTSESQTAPLPYTTIRDGNWTDATATTPWTYGDSVWDIPNSVGIDGSTKVDWGIVEVIKDSVAVDTDVTVYALIVDSDALITDEEITDGIVSVGASGGSHELEVSGYLKLDGKIDLDNESQLLQTATIFGDSQLDATSKGYVERDQQGTENAYTYNYWSSPVGLRSTAANNVAFTVEDVLRSGTNSANPKTISFNDSYSYADGVLSDPVKISAYWIWKFVNLSNAYANWQHVREDGTLNVTEGYTMKGTSGASGITDEQNYVYRGKPNNGDLAHTTFPGTFDAGGKPFITLAGNPYPSALDADAFIDDNISSIGGGSDGITGTLYFWEHWSNNTHYLSSYQGGYALYTKSGGTAATSHPDIDQGGSGNKAAPGQFIPVAQGFFITQHHDDDGMGNLTNPSSGSVIFKNSQRVFEIENGNAESVFTRQEASKGGVDTPPKSDPFELTNTKKRIWLGFESPTGFHRQVLAAFLSGATDGIDRGYEGKMIDQLPNDAYFIQEHQPFSIVAFEKFSEDREIPISIIIDEESDGGIQKIMIDELDNIADDINIYIVDNTTNIYYDLRKGECEIQLASGNHEGRFSLVFKVQESLSVEDEEILKDDLTVFMNNPASEIEIRNTGNAIVKKVILYNSLGQIMNTWAENNFKAIINLPVSKLATGVYIVNLKTDKGLVSKKIIIE